MVWLLLAFLGAAATGRNVTSTSTPDYNRTTTVLRKHNANSGVPSSSYSPTATAEVKASTAAETSKSSQFVKLTKPPLAATTRHTVTQPAQDTAFAGTFVMPSVVGLVGSEIRSSMESKITPAEDRAVRTPTLADEGSFTDTTYEPSTTTTPPPSTVDSYTSVTEGFSATVTSAASMSGTGFQQQEDDDISYLSSLFPDWDLFEDSTPGVGASTLPSVPTTQPAADAPTLEKPSRYNMSRERYCIAARYCYKDLNERCIMRHMKSVCGCGRAFYRNPETLVCERKKCFNFRALCFRAIVGSYYSTIANASAVCGKLPLLVSLELPEHSYVQEVADKKTLEFKAYESAAQHLVREEAEPMAFPPLASYEPEDQAFRKFYSTEPAPNTTEATTAFELSSQIWGLVKSSEVLAGTVIDIEVTGFRPGLLVRSRLVVMSSLVHKLAGNVSRAVNKEIQRAIAGHNSTGLFLRTRNMRTVAADVGKFMLSQIVTPYVNSLALLTVNPCEDRDSNYCSPYAICTYRKQDYGMSCRCLPGYEDVSPDTGHHPGELCFSICEPGHCQNNGTCKSLGFGIECECRDWYIGNRCQFQMKRIIVIMVVVAAVLLTAVGVTFHKYWKKGRLQSCNNQVCRMLIMEPAKRSSAKRLIGNKMSQSARAPPSSDIHRRATTCVSPGSDSLRSGFSRSLEDGLSQAAVSVISK
ncbi:hypothetical protein HPB50_024646 [Hyalomma asiaticum]|uniref:Uncharacterized protein n=1 Tax=Hyalomma asiaticum TaxID=266040 RepID=A0ACB7SYQ8_HYAAI|nr:hypothetical protein HPB50_024646 [Hyalomma asiaticum]